MKKPAMIFGAIGIGLAAWKFQQSKLEDIDILARTIYGEARGQSRAGKEAVAAVVINRSKTGGWWGSGISEVCLKPWQFSCWNRNDPNSKILIGITPDNPVFRECLEIAALAVTGNLNDRTSGATHYYANYIRPPNWIAGATKTASIGVHKFYKNVG